jgi:chorismate-pyruvate lyase
VNPHDELQSLIDMFPNGQPLLADAEHVASQTLPEPYRRMLAHNHHMTVTMESYHRCPVDVRILDRRLDGDFYNRKIILLKHGADHVVQFGLVRFDLSYVTQAVRDEIIAGEKPLGRVLIDHNVLRHIDLGPCSASRRDPRWPNTCKCRKGALPTVAWRRFSATGTPRWTYWRLQLRFPSKARADPTGAK